MEMIQDAKEMGGWDKLSADAKVEILRRELRVARDSISNLIGIVQRLRLQVQNHMHNDATGQVMFPAGVFEPQQSPLSRYDPLA